MSLELREPETESLGLSILPADIGQTNACQAVIL